MQKLEIFFTEAVKVVDLFHGAPYAFPPSLLLSNYHLCFGFKPVEEDFQHNFASMTYEADASVLLAEL
ncbi:MAG: hypothetical protein AB2693_05055 [Candidatus Thiodiazotropha sp.]